MTSEIHKWQIYCNDENSFIDYYGATAPTYCPRDPLHNINPDGIIDLGKVKPDKIIVDSWSPDRGSFQTRTEVLLIPPSDEVLTTTKNFSYPFDIYIISISLTCGASNVGDELDVQFGPDTPIGVIPSPIAEGDIVIHVPLHVVSFMHLGAEIGILNTSNGTKEYPGMVIEYDEKDATLKVETPFNNSFPSGSVILFSKYPARKYIFDSDQRMTIGGKGLTSSYLPKNTVVRCIYTDNTPSPVQTKAYIGIQYYMT